VRKGPRGCGSRWPAVKSPVAGKRSRTDSDCKRQGKHTIDRFNPPWVARFHDDRWNADRARFLADLLGCRWKNSEGARQVPLPNGMTLAGAWSFAADLPTPILEASFCRIFLHIGIPTFFRRIVDRPG
jgi:hypothetical protein